ncbi:hypothetical protein ACTVPQ_22025 [Serratia bockelmannii]|uniref:hypothetical protein n=1 Tax=Serratia bockelmannii TaxID=2703793 RepID=UPI003FA7A497
MTEKCTQYDSYITVRLMGIVLSINQKVSCETAHLPSNKKTVLARPIRLNMTTFIAESVALSSLRPLMKKAGAKAGFCSLPAANYSTVTDFARLRG